MAQYERIDLAALARCLRDGKTISEAAVVLGRDYHSIYPAARRLGLVTPGRESAS